MAYDARGLQFSDLVARQAQLGQQLMIMLPEQRRRLHVNTCGSAGQLERQCAVSGARVHRMADLLEKATSRELGQFGLAVGLHHLADGHAVAPQVLDDVVPRSRRAPRGQVFVDDVVVYASRLRCGVLGRSLGLAKRGPKPFPLIVRRHRNRNPAVCATELVDLVGAV